MKAVSFAIGIALVLYGTILYFHPAAACRFWLCAQESATTLSEMQRALEFDPASAYRWADLAEAFAEQHQPGKAQESFQRAVQTGPRNPAILVRAANFYFASGDYPATMRLFARVLDEPELKDYYVPAFLTYTRMDVPISEVLRSGLPKKRMPAEAFLRFLMEENAVQSAETTWDWMQEQQLTEAAVEGEYVGFLMRNGRVEQAAETWAKVTKDAAYRTTNWLFNGEFDADPKASPMDWHLDSFKDVQLERVRAHDGKWCVQVVFAGQENIALHDAYQYAVLRPGRWRLHGLLKTAGITTDQGVSLRLFDALQSQRLDLRTDAMVGSQDWTAVERTFQVTPPTQLVRVELVRDPSEKFGNKIAGTAWLESVELSPVR